MFSLILLVLVIVALGASGFLVGKTPGLKEPFGQRLEAVRSLYIYVVAFVGLIMVIVSVVGLLSLALKATIFTKADQSYISAPVECTDDWLKTMKLTPEQCEKRKADERDLELFNRSAARQSTLSFHLSFLLIGLPLFVGHARKTGFLYRKNTVV